jgi:hypothetical protein
LKVLFLGNHEKLEATLKATQIQAVIRGFIARKSDARIIMLIFNKEQKKCFQALQQIMDQQDTEFAKFDLISPSLNFFQKDNKNHSCTIIQSYI